jgi:hypothetical protein
MRHYGIGSVHRDVMCILKKPFCVYLAIGQQVLSFAIKVAVKPSGSL